MSPDDERWSRVLRLRPADAKFAHAVIERGAVHAEARRGAAWTADHPTRFAEDAQNVIALDGFERRRAVGDDGGTRRAFEFSERNLERRAARQDHAAFDEILQLANVAGPVVTHQRGH